MTIVNKKCLDCGKDFEYDEKPGYPRKYCFSCSAERKKSYAEKDKDKVPAGFQTQGLTQEQNKKAGSHTTMYVSYAKDIFCALVNKDLIENMDNGMNTAIELVKQARGEFE